MAFSITSHPFSIVGDSQCLLGSIPKCFSVLFCGGIGGGGGGGGGEGTPPSSSFFFFVFCFLFNYFVDALAARENVIVFLT